MMNSVLQSNSCDSIRDFTGAGKRSAGIFLGGSAPLKIVTRILANREAFISKWCHIYTEMAAAAGDERQGGAIAETHWML